VEHDLVARLDVSDEWTSFQHLSESLMSKQVRDKLVWAFGSIDLVKLSSADTTEEHLDQDLAC
jgi:hypothetical protein